MFQRRQKRHIGHHLREFFWPRAGWRRVSIYMASRVKRMPDTPYSIAAGFACGAAVSFTPFMGFHFVLAALIARIIHANILASAIGTAVGNPWTFPFIWAGTHNLGVWVLGRQAVTESLPTLSMANIFDNFWEVFLPMMTAGIPVALVVWVIFFFPLRRAVAGYQARRRHEIEKKRRDLQS
ncbi:MAG: DUF2062 domain-containing protein [Alphaproteobacteria bacterium]|nr:DUF2062 domain-containing protein [Alphaproteobacteria bacterium]HJO88912.1 DUF2062 domain-containing protein [Alphaproteobacteria bacterium]